MNKTFILFTILISSMYSSQESFTMKYGCYQILKNGIWSKTIKTNLQVDFSTGSNKDLILTNNNGKQRFIRTADPFVSETAKGLKFQVITTKSNGGDYVFQYFENYNLRLIDASKNVSYEYSCVKNFDEDVGTNHNFHSVIVERAYFHNSPNKSTRRSGYLVYGEVVEPLSEKSGFVYVIYKNSRGQISKGWILKSDLESY